MGAVRGRALWLAGLLALVIAAAVVVVVVAGSGSDDSDEGSRTAAPASIKIGGVFTEGASVGFPTSGSRTLRAFFSDYNAAGGLDGRKVEVITGNDGGGVEKNIALTKRMIEAGAMAFVGTESVVDCLGNAGLYRQANVYSIGYGGQQACFALKQFGSVAQSIQTATVLSTQWATRNVGGKVCFIGYAVPGSNVVYERTDQMLAKLGLRFAQKTTDLPPTANPTAALLEARRAGCRTTVSQIGPGQDIQLVNAKAAQRIRNMTLILQNGHDYNMLKATGKNADGNYAFSYVYPFSANDSTTKAFRQFTDKHDIPADNFSVIAYVSAQLFVDALKRVDGEVTRQSVGEAISKLDVANAFMPGGRFVFGGAGSGNAPNIGGFMVAIENGAFTKAPGSEMLLPASVRSLAGA